MRVSDLTPEALERIYEQSAGIKPRDARYGWMTYDYYLRIRYKVEVEIPREKARGEKEDYEDR